MDHLGACGSRKKGWSQVCSPPSKTFPFLNPWLVLLASLSVTLTP
jgi:hypothetical protein